MICSIFIFKRANYATLTTSNSITSEYISWNNNSHKDYKGLLVNTKNANTFTGKQGKDSIDTIAKNLSEVQHQRIKNQREQVNIKIKDLILHPPVL